MSDSRVQPDGPELAAALETLDSLVRLARLDLPEQPATVGPLAVPERRVMPAMPEQLVLLGIVVRRDSSELPVHRVPRDHRDCRGTKDRRVPPDLLDLLARLEQSVALGLQASRDQLEQVDRPERLARRVNRDLWDPPGPKEQLEHPDPPAVPVHWANRASRDPRASEVIPATREPMALRA